MGKSEIILIIILFNLFLLLFIVGILVFIRQYKLKKIEHNAILSNQEEMHQKEMLATQIEIQTETMQHIGREIHDNIGQKLTLASLYAQQLAFENKAPLINKNIENISEIINNSLAELRQLSKSLTDDTVNSLKIHDLIRNECSKINLLKKSTIYFKTNASEIDLSYEIKVVLYRIIQEFFQNSIKYANCKAIYVELYKMDELVKLILIDDGIGFDVENLKRNGIGLKNMKKRATIIKANFKLESSNKGTTVTLEIPFTDEKQHCNC